MEIKKVMIDGVDVSGCKYLNKVVNEEPYCNIDEEHLYTCSSDENCYFKQLARKTQECEALKSESFTRESLISIQEEEIDRYRKALEEIEEYIYNNTDFDINDSIQSKTAGYDILQIIKDV